MRYGLSILILQTLKHVNLSWITSNLHNSWYVYLNQATTIILE